MKYLFISPGRLKQIIFAVYLLFITFEIWFEYTVVKRVNITLHYFVSRSRTIRNGVIDSTKLRKEATSDSSKDNVISGQFQRRLLIIEAAVTVLLYLHWWI